jgi:hypothetical protein
MVDAARIVWVGPGWSLRRPRIGQIAQPDTRERGIDHVAPGVHSSGETFSPNED